MHSGTITGPGVPRGAMWMWAAVAAAQPPPREPPRQRRPVQRPGEQPGRADLRAARPRRLLAMLSAAFTFVGVLASCPAATEVAPRTATPASAATPAFIVFMTRPLGCVGAHPRDPAAARNLRSGACSATTFPLVLRRLVESNAFVGTILAVILANAVVLGLQTYDGVDDRWGDVLDTLDTIFLAIFVVELSLRFASYWPRPRTSSRAAGTSSTSSSSASPLYPGSRSRRRSSGSRGSPESFASSGSCRTSACCSPACCARCRRSPRSPC